MQRERLLSGPQGSLFMLLLEREAGILVATDFGFLLCTRHCAYLSFILLGRYHHCPFYRWHFWGPEILRYLTHYVVICRPGNLVCLPLKLGTFHCHRSLTPHMEDQGKADPADSGGTYSLIRLLRRSSTGRGKEVGFRSQCLIPGSDVSIDSHQSSIQHLFNIQYLLSNG